MTKQRERCDRIAKHDTNLDADDAPVLTLLDHLNTLGVPSRLGALARRWSSDAVVSRYLAIHLDHRVVDAAPSI